jgi:hypothetical protein
MDSTENLGISWAGEWLPMELWFKVFQYYCISQPIPTDADTIKILESHPTIAEILDRFLPYLGGPTFEILQARCRTSPNWDESMFQKSLWTHCTVVQDFRDQDGNFQRSGQSYKILYDYQHNGYFGIGHARRAQFAEQIGPFAAHIRIAADGIFIRTKRMFLADCAITDMNRLLPYGCFVKRTRNETLSIYVPYPPGKRDRNGKRYKCIYRLYQDQEVVLYYDTDFLYIPPWRPR